jgi:hypothetical protein
MAPHDDLDDIFRAQEVIFLGENIPGKKGQKKYYEQYGRQRSKATWPQKFLLILNGTKISADNHG